MLFRSVDIKPYENVARAKKFIQAVMLDIETKEAEFWGLERDEDHVVLGTVCVWNYDDLHIKAELGYELNPKFYKQGYMNEAIKGVLEYLKSESELKTLDAITHEANVPSLKLLENHQFVCLGKANEVDPELDETPEMLLYRIHIS